MDFLWNNYKCPVEWEGIVYPTAEHAFQASKVINPALRMLIAAAASPAEEIQETRWDWDNLKFGFLLEITKCKFYQNKDLAEKLLATGNKEIICDENHLGLILMIVRKELQMIREMEKDLEGAVR